MAPNHDFQLGDLVELKSESEWNPSLFRIRAIDDTTALLGQLRDDTDDYIGLDTTIDIDDPELIHARPAILAHYPHATTKGTPS